MLGAIAGDIIGSRFEFDNYRGTDFDLFGGGCSFTDDTICTIAVADAVIRGVPFADSLRSWCRRHPHPMGGYGGRFAQWLRTDGAGPYGSYGNGSAMRVSPCAWLAPDREAALALARESAACTHDHPEGVRGAVCVADCIWHARAGAPKGAIRDLAEGAYGYAIGTDMDAMREGNSFDETCPVTVPQAIACVLESGSFEHAVRLAVSIGGDSDTIAAIAGSIAEACHGIPEGIAAAAEGRLTDGMGEVLAAFRKRVKTPRQ